MANATGKDKETVFDKAVTGRDIPVLTLDNKWYRLLDRVGRENVKPLEDELNELLKKQGKVNNDIKEVKKLKKRLMEEIVALVSDGDVTVDLGSKTKEEKIFENKRLVEECNEKLDEYQENLLDFPHEIDEVNRKLMVVTMEHCYETMQDNTDEIEELDAWVTKIRIELKKNLVRKQEKEAKNHEIYSYMHDIFGPEVVDMFDLRYDPEKHHPMSRSEIEQRAEAEKAESEKQQAAAGAESQVVGADLGAQIDSESE